MTPDPIIGKYYKLYHKRISGCRTFRGIVLIVDIGTINQKLIFKTAQRGNSWFYWEDWDYEYIGDLQ